MTSLKRPYINPYPILCLECKNEMTEDNIKNFKESYRVKREIKLECFNCASQYKVIQKPLDLDYKLTRLDDKTS
jgi:hypothetical protein